jgi:hypothetical protein
MKTFEIMFDDLTPDAQKRFLEFQGCESESDGNWEVVPIATVDLEDDATEDEEGLPQIGFDSPAAAAYRRCCDPGQLMSE